MVKIFPVQRFLIIFKPDGFNVVVVGDEQDVADYSKGMPSKKTLPKREIVPISYDTPTIETVSEH